MQDDKKLKKIADILAVVNKDTVTPAELIEVISLLVDMMAKANKSLADELATVAQSVGEANVGIREECTQMMEAAKTAIILAAEKVVEGINTRVDDHATRLDDLEEANEYDDSAEMDQKVSDARAGAVEDVKNELPNMGASIRDALVALVEGDKLPVSAIEGLQELIDKLDAAGSKGGVRLVGGTNGIQLYVNGVKKGNVKYINLIAGTNMTISHTVSSGRNDILFSAAGGGSGFTKLPATGTVDGSNAAFTFTQKPAYIIADGAWYQENNGWTWDAGTLTATMSIPPSSDIYGFV